MTVKSITPHTHLTLFIQQEKDLEVLAFTNRSAWTLTMLVGGWPRSNRAPPILPLATVSICYSLSGLVCGEEERHPHPHPLTTPPDTFPGLWAVRVSTSFTTIHLISLFDTVTLQFFLRNYMLLISCNWSWSEKLCFLAQLLTLVRGVPFYGSDLKVHA